MSDVELNEEFLKMQTRTMKDNLIIAGIPESVNENTETVIKTFINDILNKHLSFSLTPVISCSDIIDVGS
jgi:hypothetical protein